MLPSKNINQYERSKIMAEVREISKLMREMEDWAEKLEIDISNNPLYLSIRSYKRALNDIIEK